VNPERSLRDVLAPKISTHQRAYAMRLDLSVLPGVYSNVGGCRRLSGAGSCTCAYYYIGCVRGEPLALLNPLTVEIDAHSMDYLILLLSHLGKYTHN
jgi:hypothetical protein